MSNLYQLSFKKEGGQGADGGDPQTEQKETLQPDDNDQQDLDHSLGEIANDVNNVELSGVSGDEGWVPPTDEAFSTGRQDERNPPAAAAAAAAVMGQGDEEIAPIVALAGHEDEENPVAAVENPASVQAAPPPQDGTQGDEQIDLSSPAERQTTFEGVLAQDPQQVRDQMLEDAIEAKDVRVFDETGGKSRRWIPIAIVVIVLLVLAAVGATLGVVIPRRKEASSGTAMPTYSPSQVPSTAPSEAPTTSSFSIVAQAVEAAFGTTLEDSTSPQYRAAEWMAEEDQLISSPSDDLSRFAQRYAAVVLYYATGGDTTWNRQANFLSPTLELCNWKEDAPVGAETFLGILGIECLGRGQVLAIEFIQNNLTGALPDELGAFPFLNTLVLNKNSLVGTVPATLFNSNFQYLSLPFNNVTGTLPTEIGKFGKLIQCWFQESSLSSTIPTELGTNSGLQALTIASSSLNGTIPETLLNLGEMFLLDLSNNNLSGSLPQEFPTRWPKMQQASFNSNRLTGSLPSNIGVLSELRTLGASYNNFTGRIPDSLLNISALEILSVESNELTGSLPSDWSRLSVLGLLSLASNLLTGSLPVSMGNLTSLTTASLAQNQFTSTIPEELWSLTNLSAILFQENQFTGTVPTSFRQWTRLRALTVSYNELTGDMSFLCDPNDETMPWSPSIQTLHADCLGEVVCPCCNLCCDPNDTCEFQ